MSANKTNTIALSIVIPSLNRPDNLMNVLQSILQQSVPPMEIVVVDSSNNADTENLVNGKTQVFLEKAVNLRYIWESPKGITHARNVGVRAAAGNTVLFMDDDLIASKHFVREILKVFEINPDAVGVQGFQFPPQYWEGFSLMTNFVNVFRRAFLLTHLEKNKQGVLLSGDIVLAYPLSEIIVAKIIYPSGSAFKREVLLQIPLDEKLRGYSWREEYFTLRLSQLHPNCLFVTPFATFFHDTAPNGRPTNKRIQHIAAAYELYTFNINLNPSFKNWIAFFWKWFGKIIVDLRCLRSRIFRMRALYTFESFFWVFKNFDKVRSAEFNIIFSTREK